MLDLLLSTWTSLRAHALRFTLTSLGIVWGSFMLTYLSATTEGTDRHFMRVMEKAGPKIVYMGGGAILFVLFVVAFFRWYNREEEKTRAESLEYGRTDLGPEDMTWTSTDG